MRIAWRRLFGFAGRAALVSLVLFTLVYLFATATNIGRAGVARMVADLSDGQVVIHGLHGDLPAYPRIDTLALKDDDGVWLRAENVELDWHPLSALFGPLDVDRIAAARVRMLRQPLPPAGQGKTPAFRIGHITIARIDAEKGALGNPANFTASGAIAYGSVHDLSVDFDVRRLDSAGTYRAHIVIAHDILTGWADIAETKDAVGGVVGLPDLNGVTLQARASARGQRNSISLAMRAGALTAGGEGTINLASRLADIAFTANAPAMQPRRDLSWTSLSAEGRMHGSFDAPMIAASLRIANLAVNGFGASRIAADVNGQGGTGTIQGTVEQLTIPAATPRLFASTPVTLSGRTDFEAARRSLVFAVSHPLLSANGTIDLRAAPAATVTVTAPSLAPLAGLAGIDLRGSSEAVVKLAQQQDGATAIALDGRIAAVPDGAAGRLLGRNATFAGTALLRTGGIASLKAAIAGAGLAAHASGASTRKALDYEFDLALPNLAAIASELKGSLRFDGTLKGAIGKARLAASGSGTFGAGTVKPERIALALNANGMPNPKSGEFSITGRLAGAPLALGGMLLPEKAGALRIALKKAAWKSLRAGGEITTGGGAPLRGKATIDWARLADAAPLLAQDVDGALHAELTLVPERGRSNATVAATLARARFEGVSADRLRVDGNVADALSAPRAALKLAVDGYSTANASGDATLTLDGPMNRLALRFDSKSTVAGAPLVLNAVAAADDSRTRLVLQSVSGTWSGKALALAHPATFDYAKGIAVDALDATFGGARLSLKGRVTPTLALTASADNVTPDLLRLFLPSLTAEGVLSASARLGGTIAAPDGSFTLTGRNLRAPGVPVTSVAVAALDAHGTLRKGVATVSSTLEAGKSAHLELSGSIPLTANGRIDLRANGTADLAILSAYTTVRGQTVGGKATIDGGMTGTFARPVLSGSMKVSDADFSDFARHFSLTGIAADVEADGTRLRLVSLTAKAQQGTITGSGTIDLAAPGMPVSIALRASNAQPISSDLVTARLNADLKVTGELARQTSLAGTVTVVSGNINLPEKFPPDIATLNVRRRGAPPPPPPSSRNFALDVTLAVPSHVYVRGRGLEAELYGTLTITGSSNAPVVLGALTMRRGTFSIAGQTLDIQSGRVGFDGNSLRYRLDPTLDFVAQTSSGGVTATLKITGYASAPKIQLTSTPTLPQDEILARLLFQQSAKQLSPVQYAEIAQAIASLAGAGSGIDPIGTLRTSLGLDRLAIGSETTATGAPGGTTIEAGRYVAEGIYLGVRQSFSGGQRAIVQYDVTKNFKLQATANTGTTTPTTTSTSTAEDRGNSVGMTYQFDY